MSKANGNRVKVSVDSERCLGSGHCELLEDKTFYVDDETSIASVIGDGLLLQDRAEEVMDRCPSGAIGIEKSDRAS